MTRLPSNRLTSLALSLGLCLGGCGRERITSPNAAHVAGQSPPVIASDAPRLFAVPLALAPLPHPEPELKPVAPQSVQAQYSQTAGPPPAHKTQELQARSPASIYAPQAEVQQAAAPLPARQQLREPAAPAPSAHSAAGQQAQAMTQRATSMAQKGMLFAAKDELVRALQLLAQSRDADQGTTWHAKALSAGLTALKEADDFSSAADSTPVGHSAAEIVRGHRTTILQTAGEVSPAVARQYYLSYAQQQLTLAVAGQPAASQTLYVLGKVPMALAGPASDKQSLHGPRAMVCYQAALAVDPRNYQAANELGVLLAHFGNLAEAKRALLHSITIQPHVEGWHNLATVHRGLGETALAELAENERQKLANQSQRTPAGDEKMVTWVDPRTFAASGNSPPDGTALASRSANSTSSQSQRR